MAYPLRPVLAAALVALLVSQAAPASAQKVPPGPKRPPAAEPPPALFPPEEPPPPYPPLQGEEAQAVREVVRHYQDAVHRRDGVAAARLVSRQTREYYGRMRDMAVSAPEAQVRAAPLMDRLVILMYRHRLSASELRALPAEQAFAYTISAGWVTATDGQDVAERGEVYGQGDRAVLRYAGEMHFNRENGVWLWDMMPMLLGGSEEFAEGLDSPEEEDEFLLFVLKHATGRDPSPDIWRPLP